MSGETGTHVQSEPITGTSPLVPAMWRSAMTEVSAFQGHPQGVRILVMPLTGYGVLDKDLNLEQEVRSPALYRDP